MDRREAEQTAKVTTGALKNCNEVQPMADGPNTTGYIGYGSNAEDRINKHVGRFHKQAMEIEVEARRALYLLAFLRVLPREMPHDAEMGLRYLLERAGI